MVFSAVAAVEAAYLQELSLPFLPVRLTALVLIALFVVNTIRGSEEVGERSR